MSEAARKLRADRGSAAGPPLTAEELTTNLSLLENRLNADMKCPAGRNQVYIRSLITGRGTTRPRIALKCPLRTNIGERPEVFFEHIRDVCCGDHEACPAWQALQTRHTPT
jgi:hypothetical protein